MQVLACNRQILNPLIKTSFPTPGYCYFPLEFLSQFEGYIAVPLQTKNHENGEPESIGYSDKYTDNVYEYRHVILPSDIAELVPRNHLMTETLVWRQFLVFPIPLVGYILWSHQPRAVS
ncbi:Cyclin-dependent kinases regulatory subunit like protein [Argiope bruennichi]|uniref:Cyclin-dependent kinases regulatory subunit n=1 Tax=Argiope bruennichi TaxID=94029 RepID=A0A8T0E7I6_ARGBR|nr:Cyclin-dependent kinases regulatory subunit like protein [Argiope bruennichi]